MLKIYAGQDLFNIKNNSCWLLFPFTTSIDHLKQHWNQKDKFDLLVKNGHSYLKLVSLEEADCVISPFYWMNNQKNANIHLLHNHIQKYNKKLIIFHAEDAQELIPLKNTLVFTYGLEANFKPSNYFVYPFPSINHYNFHTPRNLSKKPTVNFCGRALQPFKPNEKFLLLKKLFHKFRYSLIANTKIENTLRKLSIHATKNIEARVRAQSIIPFKKDPRFQSNVIIRNGFLNNVNLNNSPESWKKFNKLKNEYTQNLLSADFIPCPRGVCNNSIRFYETLSAGRIPIFINTGCTLPFENIIDWKKYTVWIEEHELHKITDIVHNYYHSLSEDTFIQKQKDCRKLWEDYLSPLGFASKLHLILNTSKKSY